MRSNVPQPPYTPGWSSGQDHGWAQPPKRRRTGRTVAIVLAVLVVALVFVGLCAFGSLVAHDASKSPGAGVATIEPPASSGGTRKAPATLAEGDHQDVKAGTYTTTASADGFGCTWQRVKRFDHDLSSVIAGDIVSPGATGIMVIKSTDAGVELAGDCKWVRK